MQASTTKSIKSSNAWTSRDLIFCSIATVIALVIQMIIMGASSLFGIIGHQFSVAFYLFFTSIVFVYMLKRVDKPGVAAFFTLLPLVVFCLMGGFTPVWVATTTSGALIAELILAGTRRQNKFMQATALGVIGIGNMLGAYIPALLFADKFYEEWVSRGSMSPEAMTEYIAQLQGVLGITIMVVSFVLPFIGVLIARKILKRYDK